MNLIKIDNRYLFWSLLLHDGRGFLFPVDNVKCSVNALEIYNPQNFKAKLLKYAIKIAIRTKLFHIYANHQKIKTYNANPSTISILQYLDNKVGQQDTNYAISLGTPNAHQKPVRLFLSSQFRGGHGC